MQNKGGVSKSGIGLRIKAAREALGMDQTNFGDAIGIASRNTVSIWERGLTCPQADILTLLHHKYRISADWIVSGEGEMFVGQTEAECAEASNDTMWLLMNLTELAERGSARLKRLMDVMTARASARQTKKQFDL